MAFTVLKVSLALAAVVASYSVLATETHGWGHQDVSNHGWDHHDDKSQGWGSYKYNYGVNDHHTGDVKSAQESSQGGWTKGSYSLLQPDGKTRTVHYEADAKNGFRAKVEYSGWAKPEAHGWAKPESHGWGKSESHGWGKSESHGWGQNNGWSKSH